MSKSHKIHKQVLDIELSDNNDTYNLQNRVRDVFNDSLLSIIEQQLDELTPNGELLKIDKLEIDLGRFDIGFDFERLLKDQLEKVFRESLVPIKQEIKSGTKKGIHKNVSNNSELVWTKNREEESAMESLLFFLERGYFPWSSSSLASTGITSEWKTDLIDAVLEDKADVLHNWIRRRIDVLSIRQRVLSHFSLDQIKKLIEIPFLTELNLSQQSISVLLHEIESISDGTLKLTKQKEKAILWYLFFILSKIQSSDRRKYLLLPTLIRALIMESPSFQINGKKFFDEVRGNGEGIQQLLAQFSELRIEVNKLKDELPPIFDVDVKPIKEKKLVSLERWFAENKSIEQLNELLPLKTNEWYSNWVEYIKKVGQEEMKSEPFLDKEDLIIEELNTMEKESHTEENGISVTNSGLILLAYFLPYLFDHLGWLDEDRQLREDAQKKALSASQFLITGKEEVDESLLPLNKAILGIELESALANDYALTKEEKEECEKLLHNVILQWKALGNTSIEGLRQAFLQRNGILHEREDGFLLRVEGKSLDVLIDRLPWSIGIIKTAWMNKIMTVEW